MRAFVRRSVGMARVILHLARGAGTVLVVFPLIDQARRRRIVQRWSEGVLQIFGLSLQVSGLPPQPQAESPVLIVGNHISWVDIYAYLSVADVRFVAKSEVRSWPLIGWFAARLGTIFVERDRPRDAVRVGHEIRAALEAGQSVCVFPEGTTTDGSVVLPFSSVLVSAAIDTSMAVQPVSIAYRRPSGEPCLRAAFTGDATLVASIWALAGGGTSNVELRFLEPLDTGGADRRALTRRAEDCIRRSLGHEARLPATTVIVATANSGSTASGTPEAAAPTPLRA